MYEYFVFIHYNQDHIANKKDECQRTETIYNTLILILSSSVADKASGSVRLMNRILSKASEALDINSLRKICDRNNIYMYNIYKKLYEVFIY